MATNRIPLPSLALALGTSLIFSGCSSTTEITTSRTETTFLSAPAATEIDFKPLFNGRDLSGWKLLGQVGEGFRVKDRILICPEGGGGKLLTEKQYANFIMRFEFRLSKGANNGIVIRAPFTAKSLAYDGMELQILDDSAADPDSTPGPNHSHGSLYDVLQAKRGALRPAGEWNEQEIIAKGRRIWVTVNGKVILEADLNAIKDPAVIQKHPGLFKERGHIGLMGHKDFCAFRNIRIKELPSPRVYNRADDGFDQLFSGSDLKGWHGGLDSAFQSASPGDKVQEVKRQVSDLNMQTHWTARGNALVCDGQGADIFSEREYGDFELSLEYKVEPGATGGVLPFGLSGVVVQDRDTPGNERIGSGGLHDGNSLYKPPSKYADHFAGAWNRLRVILSGGRTHVFLNDELVVNNVSFKNPNQTPLPSAGPIGLASGRGKVSYRSIYARGIAAAPVLRERPKLAPLPEMKRQSKEEAESAPLTPQAVGTTVVTESVGPVVLPPTKKKATEFIGEMKLIEDR